MTAGHDEIRQDRVLLITSAQPGAKPLAVLPNLRQNRLFVRSLSPFDPRNNFLTSAMQGFIGITLERLAMGISLVEYMAHFFTSLH